MITNLRESAQNKNGILGRLFKINKDAIVDDFVRWGGSIDDFIKERVDDSIYDAGLDPYEEDEQQLLRKGIDSAFEFDESESKQEVLKTIWSSFWDYLEHQIADCPEDICNYFQYYLGITYDDIDKKLDRFGRLKYDLQQEIIQTVMDGAYELLDPFIKEYEDDIVDCCEPLQTYFETIEKEKYSKQDEIDSMAEFGDDDEDYDYGI